MAAWPDRDDMPDNEDDNAERVKYFNLFYKLMVGASGTCSGVHVSDSSDDSCTVVR